MGLAISFWLYLCILCGVVVCTARNNEAGSDGMRAWYESKPNGGTRRAQEVAEQKAGPSYREKAEPVLSLTPPASVPGCSLSAPRFMYAGSVQRKLGLIGIRNVVLCGPMLFHNESQASYREIVASLLQSAIL